MTSELNVLRYSPWPCCCLTLNHPSCTYRLVIAPPLTLYQFKVNDDPRRRAILDISPTSALLPPNGRVPIEVTFCPREEKFHNFNLIFNVRKKQTKLSINVKGEGFKVMIFLK